MVSVSIVGASGYVGGELLRLLLDHPQVVVQQATSERLAGRYLTATHPNLRGRTDARFVPLAELAPLFVPFDPTLKHQQELPDNLKDCRQCFLNLPHSLANPLACPLWWEWELEFQVTFALPVGQGWLALAVFAQKI